MTLPDANDVTSTVNTFWFGDPDDPDYGKSRAQWFTKDANFDASIRDRFEGWIEAAGNGELDHLAQTGLGAVALMVLLDQFPRNAYRGDPRSFSYDAKALAIAKDVVARKLDQAVPAFMRTFLYLPFEHSENTSDQAQCLELFAGLGDDGGDGLEWAKKHYEIIKRFGRFPHRNAVLGRPSTPEELDFLKEPGSSF